MIKKILVGALALLAFAAPHASAQLSGMKGSVTSVDLATGATSGQVLQANGNAGALVWATPSSLNTASVFSWTGSSHTFTGSSGIVVSNGSVRGKNGSAGSPTFCSDADGCDSGLYFNTDQAILSAGSSAKITLLSNGITLNDILRVTSGNGTTTVSISGSGDTNTGFSWPNTDKVFFVANGAKAGQWGTDGLQVEGHVTASSITATGTLGQGIVLSCSTGLTTTSTGAITGCVASDRKLKTSILDMPADVGSVVDALRPRLYKWKPGQGRDDGNHAGFIAQEVKEVFPRAVVPAGKDTLGVDPNALIAVLVREVQQLRERVAALEAPKGRK